MSRGSISNRAAANGNHPDVVKILIERFWQSGRYQDVVDRLKDLKDDADADLLAFKAMSLYELDRKSESAAIIELLSSHEGQRRRRMGIGAGNVQ